MYSKWVKKFKNSMIARGSWIENYSFVLNSNQIYAIFFKSSSIMIVFGIDLMEKSPWSRMKFKIVEKGSRNAYNARK